MQQHFLVTHGLHDPLIPLSPVKEDVMKVATLGLQIQWQAFAKEHTIAGADEVDCVLEPRDDDDFPNDMELAKLIAMRESSQGLILKVIVETPLLDERKLRAVTRMALSVGADFVKTCTGKRGHCSEEAASTIAYEIGRHCLSFEGKPGLKLSGGVSSRGDAERLIALVKEQESSISGPSRLRIGSSSLLLDLIY